MAPTFRCVQSCGLLPDSGGNGGGSNGTELVAQGFHYTNQSGVYTLGPKRPSEVAMWDELQSAMVELTRTRSVA